MRRHKLLLGSFVMTAIAATLLLLMNRSFVRSVQLANGSSMELQSVAHGPDRLVAQSPMTKMLERWMPVKGILGIRFAPKPAIIPSIGRLIQQQTMSRDSLYFWFTVKSASTESDPFEYLRDLNYTLHLNGRVILPQSIRYRPRKTAEPPRFGLSFGDVMRADTFVLQIEDPNRQGNKTIAELKFKNAIPEFQIKSLQFDTNFWPKPSLPR